MLTTSKLTLDKGESAAGGGHPLDRSDLFETLVSALPGCRHFLLFDLSTSAGIEIASRFTDKELSWRPQSNWSAEVLAVGVDASRCASLLGEGKSTWYAAWWYGPEPKVRIEKPGRD
jgi:hypothetical protein